MLRKTLSYTNHNIIIHRDYHTAAMLLMIAFLQWCQQTEYLAKVSVILKSGTIMSLQLLFLHDQRDETHLFTSGIPSASIPSSITNYFQCANGIATVPFIGEMEVIGCDSRGCEYWNPHGCINPVIHTMYHNYK